MQPDNKIKQLIKHVKIGIIAVMFIIASATITLFILDKKFNNSSINKSKPTTASHSAAKVISLIYESNDATGLSTNSYKKQANSLATVSYKLGDYNYAASTQTNKSLLYSPLGESQSDDTATIQNHMTNFMKNLDLERVDNPKTNNTDDIKYVTFANDITICQLIDSQLVANAFQYHTITCVEKSTIAKEYLEIEKLLTIYRKTDKVDDFNFATRLSESESNVSYSIINLQKESEKLQLLFAAIDNNWSYIGNLSSGDSKYKNSKYTITPEIESKISDPKYNGYLINNLIGSK